MEQKKEIWDMTIEERAKTLLRQIPKIPFMNDKLVNTVQYIPISERDVFQDDVEKIIQRLELHLEWWSKVAKATNKRPTLIAIRGDRHDG